MANLRHCLIIPCSDKKANTPRPAYQLYKGVMMDIIHQFDIDEVFSNFEVFFLSAKLGLIQANEIIEPYNERMANSLAGQQEFGLQHKKAATTLLKPFANKDVKLFTVLSKDYQSAFDAMELNFLSTFNMVYQSRNARGIGDHRSRLKKIIGSVLSPTTPPDLFRSGCSNLTEFNGYRAAGEAIGTSLAYIDKKGVLGHVIDAIKTKSPIFLDNGLITAFTKGYELSESDVINRYVEIVKGIRGTQSLSIVIPDHPFCQDKALNTLKTFKKEIKWLATRCNVIIPFHKPVQRSVTEQAHLVAEILGATNFTAGIPCRNAKGNEWRLPISDVESLFMVKRKNGQPLIKRTHFLALSEKTTGQVFHERLSLCQMYNVAFQADACRTTALFGNITHSSRAGSQKSREVQSALVESKTKKSRQYQSFDNQALRESLFKRLLTMLDEGKSIAAFWNDNFPDSQISQTSFDDDIKAIFMFIELLPQRLIKEARWQSFIQPGHQPKHAEIRTEAIVQLFLDNLSKRTPVQQVIGF